MAKKEEAKSDFLLYQTEDGISKIEVRLENESVWLSQAQMVELFQTTKQNVSLHIRNVFEEGELHEDSVVKEYLTTASDGKKYRTNYLLQSCQPAFHQLAELLCLSGNTL